MQACWLSVTVALWVWYIVLNWGEKFQFVKTANEGIANPCAVSH